MKKLMLYSAAILMGFSINIIQADESAELLPELKALIVPQPLAPSVLEDNLFIAFLGAQYPHDDYYEVTKTALSESYANILNALPPNDFLPDDEMSQIINRAYEKLNTSDSLQWQGDWQEQKLHFFCNQYLNQDCIAQTLQNKTLIRQYIKANQPLIERYHDIFAKYHSVKWINLPREGMAISPIPPLQDLMRVSELSFAKGLIDISEGNIDVGMNQFIAWQKNINQLIANDGTGGLLPLMIAVARQQILDQYVNALLDSEYAPEISHRLAQLADLQLIYNNSIRKQAFASLYFEAVTSTFGLLEELSLNMEAEFIAQHPTKMVLTKKEELNALTHLDFYNNQDGMGMVVVDPKKLQTLLMNQLGESALDASVKLDPQYSQDDYLSYFARAYPLREEFNRYYLRFQEYQRLFRLDPYGSAIIQHKDVMCGGLLRRIVAISCEREHDLSYLKRVDTQRNYHNMVYLKIQVMLQGVNEKDLPAFLLAQGDLAIDPITQEPFKWNHETKTVSLPLIETKNLPVSIRNVVNENSEIKNLQVKILVK